MERCQSEALSLVERVLIDIHVNTHPRRYVHFWSGRHWDWEKAETYIPRLRDAAAILGKPIDWRDMSPIGIEHLKEYVGGFVYEFPKQYVIKLARAHNRCGDTVQGDERIQAEGQERFMNLEATCVNCGFKPVFLLRHAGSGEFIPEGIIVPTDADLVMMAAYWEA